MNGSYLGKYGNDMREKGFEKSHIPCNVRKEKSKENEKRKEKKEKLRLD